MSVYVEMISFPHSALTARSVSLMNDTADKFFLLDEITAGILLLGWMN